MKKIISIIGIGAALFFAPSCKKNEIKPQEPVSSNTQPPNQDNMASLYVVLASEPCGEQQKEFTSATVDIRGIKVFTTEHGWQDLTPVAEAWDVIEIQAASDPVGVITKKSTIRAGTITKIALTFGSNNRLLINDRPAPCYKIGVKETVVDLKQEVRANTIGQLALKIDVCGNIRLQSQSDQESCYILNPVMSLYSYRELPLNM